MWERERINYIYVFHIVLTPLGEKTEFNTVKLHLKICATFFSYEGMGWIDLHI